MMPKELEYYENWIGKSLKNIASFGEVYDLKSELNYSKSKDFFGLFHNKVSFSTNDSDEITIVSLIFPVLLDRRSFDKMIEHYGEPNFITVEDKLVYKSATEIVGKFGLTVSKKEYSSKAVMFEEKPTWIIWKKEFFDLSIRLDYKYEAIHIVFKKAKK